jgi:phytoene dehydrogenase-like protein
MILVPIAAGLPDSPEIRAAYREKVLDHVESVTGERTRDAIRVERIFTANDFSSAYHADKGTALGLAHTHPGIGVPMAFISSRIVADLIARQYGAK